MRGFRGIYGSAVRLSARCAESEIRRRGREMQAKETGERGTGGISEDRARAGAVCRRGGACGLAFQRAKINFYKFPYLCNLRRKIASLSVKGDRSAAQSARFSPFPTGEERATDMKKIFFAVLLALVLMQAGCGAGGEGEADASLSPDPARTETAVNDGSTHGSDGAHNAAADLVLNRDLFTDMNLPYSETAAKRGRVIKAHTPEGRASYSFENGYGEYIYSTENVKNLFRKKEGTDTEPEYFEIPGPDDLCLCIACVKIGDLFRGEIGRIPLSDLGKIGDFEYVGTRERGGSETVHEWVSEFRYSSVPAYRVIIMHDGYDFIDASSEVSVSRY